MKHLSLFIVLASLSLIACSHTPVVNPDPNHTHADFAVWIDGKQLDFSGPEFMSGTSDEKDPDHTKHHKYLHLHDGNGHVLHSHKPGLTFGQFLESIGFRLEKNIVPVSVGETDAVTHPSRSCMTTPSGGRYCDDGMFKGWLVFVNNAPLGCHRTYTEEIACGSPADLQLDREGDINDIWKYQFHDGDKILLSFGSFFEEDESGVTPDTRTMRHQWAQMTDDACLYSKTCPWRGDPPTENCIADPTVPCKI